MIKWIIVIIWVLILTYVILLCKRFSNPYKLYMIFGKKGSGKSTNLAKLAYKYRRKKYHVFSTENIPFATQIDIKSLGRFVPPPNSVLLIDEVGMVWDNRKYKDFRDDVRDYFKLQRHYRNIVYLFSQSFDIDIKLRNLTDAMYLVTSPLPFLSVMRRIKRSVVLCQPSAESEGRIADSLEFVSLMSVLTGGKPLSFTFIPRWAKYFNSHCVPELPYFKDTYQNDDNASLQIDSNSTQSVVVVEKK